MDLYGRRILVVDEDDAAWDLACEALKPTGARIMRARASGEALLTVVGTTPDVVVVDVDLHGTSALGLLRRLRKMETSKGGRIPAATVGKRPLTEEEQKLYREAGATAHIPKPLDLSGLEKTVRGLMGRQVERRAGRSRRPARRPDLRVG